MDPINWTEIEVGFVLKVVKVLYVLSPVSCVLVLAVVSTISLQESLIKWRICRPFPVKWQAKAFLKLFER